MQFVEEVNPSTYTREEVRNDLPQNLPSKDQRAENSIFKDFQLLEYTDDGVIQDISSISQLEKFMSNQLGRLSFCS